ncbi:hypothetical protein P4S65_04590 [Pseudoalteromonas sp. B131b]
MMIKVAEVNICFENAQPRTDNIITAGLNIYSALNDFQALSNFSMTETLA